MDERGHDHDGGDSDAEKNQPECLPIGDAEPPARRLRVGNGLIGQPAERVARRVIGARDDRIDRKRLRLAVARESASIWLTKVRYSFQRSLNSP